MLAVIGTHISAFFVLKYDPNTTEFISEKILNALSGFAVPVFLILSGALLLNEDKPFNDKKFIYKSWLPQVFDNYLLDSILRIVLWLRDSNIDSSANFI